MASITDAPVYPRVEVRPTQEGYSVVARKGTMHIATYVALGPSYCNASRKPRPTVRTPSDSPKRYRAPAR